jgi:hypothetical protein
MRDRLKNTHATIGLQAASRATEFDRVSEQWREIGQAIIKESSRSAYLAM